MKLVRYRATTGEKPGLLLDGEIYDLSAGFAALSHRAPTFEHVEAIAAVPVKTLQKVGKGLPLGPPLRGIGKIIGVGLELPRPRRGNRPSAAEGADAVSQSHQRAVRAGG